MAIMGMVSASRKAGHSLNLRTYGNALVHRARNDALATFGAGADYALFVDDDMVPEPEALNQLLAHRVPVVSAACTTRVPPVRLAAKVYDEKSDQFVPLEAIRPDRLVTGQFAVGAAFLLMDRATIESLREYYLSARDWLDENIRLLNRLHVRADLREKERARKEEIRRAHFEREKMLRVFDFPVADSELQLGEDIALSRKLVNLGIPVSIDASVAVGHLGEHTYGPWDLNHEESV
jgi:hypothetical protein